MATAKFRFIFDYVKKVLGMEHSMKKWKTNSIIGNLFLNIFQLIFLI